jgi:hypothetical protein
MNWKEFFRLTKSKFIVFLILLVFSTQTINYIMGPMEFSSSIWNVLFNPIRNLFSYAMLPEVYVGATSVFPLATVWNVVILSIGMFLDLLWLYAFSSLIIFIISKFKK